MENKSHAFWAGLFTILLLVAIGLTVFFFNVDRTVRVPYDLIARTNVTGLYTGAAVRYRGLGVGMVQSIRFDKSHPGEIRIRILVDTNAPITHSTFATLGFQGVTGVAFVQLDDTGKALEPLPSSIRQVAQLPLRPGLFDQLQQRGEVLIKKFERIADDADRFLNNDTHDQVMATAKSLQDAANGIAILSKQVGPVASQLPQTLTQLDKTLASANTLVSNLNRPDGPLIMNLNKAGVAAQRGGEVLVQINDTLQEMTARVGFETLPRVNALADDVGAAARSVDRATETFNRNPRSVLFGVPKPVPGPGEPGFAWPAKASQSSQSAQSQ